jgi:hypothetical protein
LTLQLHQNVTEIIEAGGFETASSADVLSNYSKKNTDCPNFGIFVPFGQVRTGL